MMITPIKTGFQPLLLVPKSAKRLKNKHKTLNSLSIFDCEGESLQEITVLIKSLVHTNRDLRSLKVTLKEAMVATEKQFCEFFSALSKLRELIHIDLNFLGCKKITNTTIFNLCSFLGNHRQLKTFSLTLSSYYITNKSVVQIAKLISKFKSLENLFLKFSKCFELTSEGVNYLISKLSRAKDLQSLGLSFHECNQIKDPSVVALTDLLPCFKKLTHFYCHFIYCGKITNPILANLAGQVGHMKALKTLSFWFLITESRIQEIKDLTLKTLFSSVSKLPHLEELSLNVSVHEDTLKYIWDPLFISFEKVKNLKKLSLHFPDNHRIMISELLRMLDSIANPQQLQKLIVDLSNRSLSDKEWIEISKCLRKFQQLTSLRIDLSKCQKITDKSFLDLLASIEQMKDVNNLSLSFGSCHQLTDESISSLPDFLSRSQQLKSVDADFSRCLNISDEAIFHIENLLAIRQNQFYYAYANNEQAV